MEFSHTPVMPDECIECLNLRPSGTYVDCTVGGAGHSALIASRLGDSGRLIAFDKDGDALEFAKKKLAVFGDKVTFVQDDFKNASRVLGGLGIGKIDGFLIDLGISSYQIDNRERGFSYLASDSPLDMRMDKRQTLTAREVVNTYSESGLAKILTDFGEETFARQIAASIVKKRQTAPIETAGQLVEIIDGVMPAKLRYGKGHTAKKTFQALRIEVNGELDGLEEALTNLVYMLKPSGRAAVLTFHSLEDRIVKQTFRDLAVACVCPPKMPICVCGKKAVVTLPFRKPLTAAPQERNMNPRSLSAKLRAAERI